MVEETNAQRHALRTPNYHGDTQNNLIQSPTKLRTF